MICWSCESEFEPTKTQYVASAFPGELTLAYICPYCGCAQYGTIVSSSVEKDSDLDIEPQYKEYSQ